MKKTIVLLIFSLVLITTLVSCKPEPQEPKYVNRACIYGEAYYNGIDGENNYYTGDDSSDAFYKIADKNLPSYKILSKGNYKVAKATCSYTKNGEIYFGGTVSYGPGDEKICYWTPDEELHVCNKDDSRGNADAVAIAVDDNGKVYVAANTYNMSDEPGYYDGSTWKKIEGYDGATSYFTNGYQKDFVIPKGGMGFSPDGKLVIVATRNGKIDNADDRSWYARPAYWKDGTFHALYSNEGLATSECYIHGFGFDQNGKLRAYAVNSGVEYFLESDPLPNWHNTIDGTGQVEMIFVDGSNVYTLAPKGESYGYWKNSDFVQLLDADYLNRIYANGSDVYVIGEKKSNAGFWKNGSFTAFPTIENYNTMQFKVSTMNYFGIGYQTVEAIEEIN